MVPSARLGKEGGTRNGARETAIYEPTRVKFNVTDIPVTIPLHSTVPHRPTQWDAADRPTLGIPYLTTDRPDGPPLARDRYPSLGNTSGRLSLAQGRPHRPYTRTRTYTR